MQARMNVTTITMRGDSSNHFQNHFSIAGLIAAWSGGVAASRFDWT
jgi:hypothetical protein